jgi:hypothetical protein
LSWWCSAADDTPRQLLAQLVSALLLHLDCCTADEVSKAVVDLCQLAQQRSDGPHIANLVGKMTEAFQRVQAASGHGSIAPASLQSASTPGAAALPAGSTWQQVEAATTPGVAATKAMSGLKPRSTRKTTQSRLLSMQRAGVPAPDSHQQPVRQAGACQQPGIVAADVDGLAQGMADKLHLSTPAPSTARSRAGRQVRFAAADTLEAMARDQEAVPASIARHAVRRQRGSNRQDAMRCRAAVDGAIDEAAEEVPGTPHAATVPQGDPAHDWQRRPQQHLATDSCCPAVVLVLDDHTQRIPWESCPGLQQQNMYR